ncbi:MAG TPA: DUF1549 domain-containing protein [Planctomycetota bacterium]|nr:DUF1549 domain-containing protein [Planctomycetota bacterium]
MRAVSSPAIILLLSATAGAVGDSPREEIRAAAREIDRLVEADLAAHGAAPNPPLDDAGFARRVYLDLLGRIPTERELTDFLGASGEDRREALIDRLSAAPGSSSHLFNWLADLLRVKSNLQPGVAGEPYIQFIKESIAANTPWDVFVRELLTSSGPIHKRGNGATGYYMRDRGMPEDNMSNTVTLFLGTRLECAQCHNHPFDRWTQREFHQMAAFTGGLKYQVPEVAQTPEARRLQEIAKDLRTPGATADRSRAVGSFGNQVRKIAHGVSGGGDGVYRLPKDYQYDDAKPLQTVKAQAIFGPAVDAKDGRWREAYARWLTSPENPRFTTVIANRLWKRFFGLGLIEPVDNLRDNTRPSNPALMKHLESTMIALGYDLRRFIRVLAYSRTYQREACAKEPDPDEAFRFPGPLLRRMRSEQLWDSLVTLAREDVDGTLRPPGEAAEPVYRDYERMLTLTPEEAKAMVELDTLRKADPARYREALKKASAGGKDPLMPQFRGGRASAGLVRASELPQPARPEHMLAAFGQSAREQIDASSTEATVPQVLALRNGFVDKFILGTPGSPARRAKDVASVFRTVLSREPTAPERERWAREVARRGPAALNDLIWALVNTREFIFVR